MATPNFDTLHLRFSYRINDPVATGGTPGVQLSVAQRSDYLNRAILLLTQGRWNEVRDKNILRVDLASLIKTQTINTFSNLGTSVASDYIDMPLSLTKDSDSTIFTYHPIKEELDSNVNSNLSNAFTVFAGKLYAYKSGVILNAETGKFYYIGSDACTEGGATDISISAKFWDTIVDIASYLFTREVGDLESAQTFKETK